jgi:hypothetical protein
MISGLNPMAPTPPIPSYSASVTSGAVYPEKRDGGHSLRYSKEEMIRIYWEGVKTDTGAGGGTLGRNYQRNRSGSCWDEGDE